MDIDRRVLVKPSDRDDMHKGYLSANMSKVWEDYRIREERAEAEMDPEMRRRMRRFQQLHLHNPHIQHHIPQVIQMQNHLQLHQERDAEQDDGMSNVHEINLPDVTTSNVTSYYEISLRLFAWILLLCIFAYLFVPLVA